MSNILIVDDEKSIRKTFEIFLKKEGYTVFLAEDVPIALDIIDKNDIDIVFTDIIMPRITGIEMLSLIKEKNANIPVIVMTGEPTVDTAKKSVKDRAHDYLIKPVSKESLLRTANFALQQKKLNDEKDKLELENQQYRDNLEILVENRTNALQEAVNGTIITISKILEAKDPYTAGHEKRVANLAFKVAEKMNLTEAQKDCLYFSGYLHDIGKLLVPAEILSKPGKLTQSEFSLVKDHVSLGFELVKDIKLPWVISDIILQHHERINGSGYPMGLTGDEMMIESKILVVADVVEAMASHRPYRAAINMDTVLDVLKSESGILFDTEVVKTIVELFEVDDYDFDTQDKKIKVEL